MGLFDRFKVIKGDKKLGSHVHQVKEGIQKLKKGTTVESLQFFSDALRKTVEDDEWVAMLGKDCGEKGYLLDYRMQRGKGFAAWFTDPSEIKNKPDKDFALLITGISKLLDPVFENGELGGIIINPDTDGMCIEKSFLLQILLHTQYECQKNPGSPQRNWGLLIPEYKEEDLMTKEDFLNFAMRSLVDHVLEDEGYDLVSANDNLHVCPNLILEKEGQLFFVAVKGYCAEEEPELDDFTRQRLLTLGKKYNVKCLYAPVGFRSSTDLLRFEQCLALKGDGYYLKFDGFEVVQ